MAGESPDKSKQQEPSGEAVRTPRDPRLGVLGEREPADVTSSGAGAEGSGEAPEDPPAERGDDRLRAAVAAWMAGEPEESGDGPRTGDDEAADASGGDARDAAGAVAAEASDEDAAAEPADADGASAVAERDGTDAEVVRPLDQPTSMLRAVTLPSEAEDARAKGDAEQEISGAEQDDASGAARDAAPRDDVAASREDEETAPGTDPRRGDVPDAGGESADSAHDTDDAVDADGSDALGAEDSAETEDAEDDGESDVDGDASGNAEGADEDRVEVGEEAAGDAERVRPAGEDGGAPAGGADARKQLDQPTTALVVPKTGAPDAEDRDDASGAEEREEAPGSGALRDQATLMFRAVTPPDSKSPKRPGPEGPGTAGKAPAAEPDAPKSPAPESPAASAADKAPGSKPAAEAPGADAPAATKPAAAAEDGGPAEARVTERPAERTSRFVPLPPEAPLAGRTVTSAQRSGTTTASRSAGAPPMPSHRPAAGPLPESERTKKQPLPPQPSEGPSGPLDLLAQLTNTPPPPETPLRVALRRVKIWTPLAVLLLIVFVTAQALRPLPDPELALTARPSFTFEGDRPALPWPAEGQAYVEIPGLGSLGSSGEQKPVPIASVAKVMTAYVILRDHPFKQGAKGKTLTVDAKAVSDYRTGKAGQESVVEVTEGQKISEYEALQALMLPSANNIARLLARWDARSEKAFVAKMNDAAKDLGMKNTRYTDPSGLTRSTVSTASDQVKLGKKAMEDPVFREISRQPFYTDSKGNKQHNYNQLIPYTGIGIKTGTSTAAGGNLLFAAEKPVGGTTQLIIGAALGQHRAPIIDTVTAASKLLIQAAQDSLVSHTVVRKGQVVGQVDDGLGGTTPVVATKDVKAVGWPGLKVDLGLTDDGNRIPHEAKAGTKVGTLTVGSGPGQVRVPVEIQDDLVEPEFGSRLTRIL